MRKATSMSFVIGGLAVGGAVFGGMAWAAKKKKQAAAAAQPGGLPAGTQPTAATPALYPVPPIPAVPGGTETSVQQRVVAALQTQNPTEMRRVASELRAENYAQAANTLDAYAAAQETNAAIAQGALNQVANVLAQPVPGMGPPTAPTQAQPLPSTVPATPATPPVAPPPPPPPPTPAQPQPTAQPTQVTIPGIPGLTNPVTYTLPPELTQALPGLVPQLTQAQPTPAPAPVQSGSPAWPETDPGKRDLATRMNMNVAASTKGKENQTLVKQFQTQEAGKAGTADGKYGITTAKDLGERYGIIPAKPMYLSTKTPMQTQKNDYNAWLSDMAARDPVRASQWGAAALY